MTGPGTWTDIVGSGEVAVIDPGPALESHLQAVLAALEPRERVAAILVTHAHLDHSGLAPALARATGAPLMAFGGAQDSRSPAMRRLVAAGLHSGGEGLDLAFAPDRKLADGEVIRGPDWALRAVHTPGHLGSHLCFAWEEVLFSGDHVMGWAPSLVSPPDGDMGAYMASLERLARAEWQLMLPAHGDPVEDPAARLADLTAHRRGREAQVAEALAAGPSTLDEVTARVYRDLSPALLPAARRNALAHLIDLAEQNLALADPFPGPDALWSRP
ncbi:MBL fold metallo-hydrolase [Rhodobacter sp. SGA-6-6]|nr:MBL fold metallo-hydrolase [Rhodobacter sp. SGA-6-6]